MDWSVGNFRKDSRWVLVGFQVNSGERLGRFSAGRKGGFAGVLGEIGGPIPSDFGGVLASVCCVKKRRKSGVLWWFSGEERVALSLGIRWNRSPLFRDLHLWFSPLFPSSNHSEFPSLSA